MSSSTIIIVAGPDRRPGVDEVCPTCGVTSSKPGKPVVHARFDVSASGRVLQTVNTHFSVQGWRDITSRSHADQMKLFDRMCRSLQEDIDGAGGVVKSDAYRRQCAIYCAALTGVLAIMHAHPESRAYLNFVS